MKFLLIKIISVTFFLSIIAGGCRKYLDAKPDSSLVIPEKLSDLQAILDDYAKMNFNSDQGSGEASADDYYISSEDWNNLYFEGDRRMYVWEKDNFFQNFPNEWSAAYNVVYISNTVFEKLEGINRTDENAQELARVKGHALFARAKSFLQVAIIWALAYDKQTASVTPGIPLRTNSDFNEVSTRSTAEETYKMITTDLTEAATLLPDAAVSPMRPSKAAAYGLLARAYLSMRAYDSCYKYADLSLGVYDQLIDLNDYDANGFYPIEQFNKEVLFESNIPIPQPLFYSRAKLDTTLYNSYDLSDLRKTIFFGPNGDGSFFFNGNYSGYNNFFSGIAVDEVLLMRAECLARSNRTDDAMEDLNRLLEKRWKTGSFIPYMANDKEIALAYVLNERRKELLMRGLRWMDVKRLNKEGYNIIIHRVLDGKIYTLEPNSVRYALPIPEEVIARSGISQNER